MLEVYAWQIVTSGERTLTNLNIAITFVGFVVALIVLRGGTERLERAPYFAYSGMLLLLAGILSFLWLWTVAAISMGILWLLLLSMFLGVATIGFFLGRFAMARSRDAYGHSGAAIAAFIPLANLILLLKAPQDAMGLHSITRNPLFTGGLGVCIGLLMIVGGLGLGEFAKAQSEAQILAAQNDTNAQAAIFKIMVKSDGVEKTLQSLTEDTGTPITVDEITTLISIKASGATLKRTYEVTRSGMKFSEQFRQGIAKSVCAFAPLAYLLQEGATIEETYVNTDGSPIGSVLLTTDNCSQ